MVMLRVRARARVRERVRVGVRVRVRKCSWEAAMERPPCGGGDHAGYS